MKSGGTCSNPYTEPLMIQKTTILSASKTSWESKGRSGSTHGISTFLSTPATPSFLVACGQTSVQQRTVGSSIVSHWCHFSYMCSPEIQITVSSSECILQIIIVIASLSRYVYICLVYNVCVGLRWYCLIMKQEVGGLNG